MNSTSIDDYASPQGVSPIQVIITTANPNIFSDLINLRMDGVQTIAPFAKVWHANVGDHAVMVEFSKDVFDIAKGLFAAWLYDKLVNKNADNSTKIGGQELPPVTIITPIYIEMVINNVVLNNIIEAHKEENTEET